MNEKDLLKFAQEYSQSLAKTSIDRFIKLKEEAEKHKSVSAVAYEISIEVLREVFCIKDY
jgi:high-affinity K+ transport system ATPase subunit B